jgi:hypothetical protein
MTDAPPSSCSLFINNNASCGNRVLGLLFGPSEGLYGMSRAVPRRFVVAARRSTFDFREEHDTSRRKHRTIALFYSVPSWWQHATIDEDMLFLLRHAPARATRRGAGRQAARNGGHRRQAGMGGFVVSLSDRHAAQMLAPVTCACSSSTCSTPHPGCRHNHRTATT